MRTHERTPVVSHVLNEYNALPELRTMELSGPGDGSDATQALTEQAVELAETMGQMDAERRVIERMVPESHPLRRRRQSIGGTLIKDLLGDGRGDGMPAAKVDAERMFLLYLLQVDYGYETAGDLMLDVHVNNGVPVVLRLWHQ